MSEVAESINVKDWEHFAQFARSAPVSAPYEVAVAYRGQARAEWSLRPSLARCAWDSQKKTWGLRLDQLRRIEGAALAEFQPRVYGHVPANLPLERRSLIFWWMLMQHCGAPTRLLDWSESPYVAAYFAAREDLEQDGAVWVIYPRVVREASQRVRKDSLVGATLRQAEERLTTPTDPPLLYWGYPALQTERMVAQRTHFFVSNVIPEDHDEIIGRIVEPGKGPALHKLVIPKERRNHGFWLNCGG